MHTLHIQSWSKRVCVCCHFAGKPGDTPNKQFAAEQAETFPSANPHFHAIRYRHTDLIHQLLFVEMRGVEADIKIAKLSWPSPAYLCNVPRVVVVADEVGLLFSGGEDHWRGSGYRLGETRNSFNAFTNKSKIIYHGIVILLYHQLQCVSYWNDVFKSLYEICSFCKSNLNSHSTVTIVPF